MGATGSAQGHPSLPTARGCLGLHGGLSQPPQTPGLNTSAGLPLTPWPYAVIQFCCCCCQGASVVSDSVGPHRRQPTRLPRPWDSPGKNTGVGCHFLLQCMKVKSESASWEIWIPKSRADTCGTVPQPRAPAGMEQGLCPPVW